MAVVALLLPSATSAAAQEPLCRNAHAFLEETGMRTVVEPDTVDDWRTRGMVPGCRITAAGLTTRSLQAEAQHLFEQVRAAEWTRTPDPRDAPNEASLRFRKDGADCLFNFYSGGLLGTMAEATVDRATVPGPGERRYNVLVLCTPAMEAAPR